MSSTPLRWLGLVFLAAIVWFLTSLTSADQGRLHELVLKDHVPQLFEGDAPLVPSTVQRIDRVGTWSQACDAIIGARLDARLAGDASAHLTIRCSGDAGAALIETRLTRPDEPPVVTSLTSPLPDFTSLLPPLLGILFALVFRKVLAALFAAVVFGALLYEGGNVIAAVGRTADDYLLQKVINIDNLYILAFTVLLVGMVHVCIRMGGMQGIVNALSRIASGRRSAQSATGAMGVAVFFDDYANTIVVGSSVRQLTDSHKISREKLAYIVDSTAAPIAGVAIISTWIGFEIEVFDEQMQHIQRVASSGYEFFFTILPYRFYCLFSLALIFIISTTGRDFGPMLRAERRAIHDGLVKRPQTGAASKRSGVPIETMIKPGAPPRWLNGILPVIVVIVGTFVAAILVGSSILAESNPAWSDGMGPLDIMTAGFVAASSYTIPILFWASLAGAATAFFLARSQRILSLGEAGRAFFNGLWGVAPVLAILVLAIALRQVTQDLGTDKYLVALVGDVAPWTLPVTIFGLASFIAFATGSSWGTMGILIPVAIPLVAQVTGDDPAGNLILVLAAASVLDGAIFGDHCSLISDTTIMSSLATGCDHVDHVRTQFPYALLAMVMAGTLGYLFVAWTSYDVPVVGVYAVGVLLMFAFVRLRGTDPALPAQR